MQVPLVVQPQIQAQTGTTGEEVGYTKLSPARAKAQRSSLRSGPYAFATFCD